MSAAVAPASRNGERLSRVTIADLRVWDATNGEPNVLQPGVVLEDCRTVRPGHSSGSYGMEFRAAGALYRCPLYEFQPRTEVLGAAEETSGDQHATLTTSSR